MKGQPYTPASIYFDSPRTVRDGEYVVTANGKTAYFVQRVRTSPTVPNRKYLSCLRWPPEDIPADARVHRLHWYRRSKK